MNATMLEPFFKEAQQRNEDEGEIFKWKKVLTTEYDYWVAIETIGSYRQSTEHGFMKGCLNTEKDGSSVLLSSAQAYLQQKQLVEELWERFGVVAPQNCPNRLEYLTKGKKIPSPPWGVRWYWDWYDEMKDMNARVMHESEVCSACPYCTGVGANWIPCSLWEGVLYRLSSKDTCALIREQAKDRRSYGYSEEEFLAKMLSDHGEEAVCNFLVKREAIRILLKEHE